jgi:DUF2911 family protein
MEETMRNRFLLVAAIVLFAALPAFTAVLTAPPSGNNQRAAVTQFIGPVKVNIEYSSPRVHNPYTGEDRRGKVWGTLVPYGLFKNNDGYGTCKECPWRVGANMNTVFTVSHDVKVQGEPLAAGSYGVFMIPEKDADWTLIFSRDTNSWGHYYYDAAHDALRVKVKPAKSDYHEYLAFEVPDRGIDKATFAMRWEELEVPFTVSVDNMDQVYFDAMKTDLSGPVGQDWRPYVQAARFALDKKLSAADALALAETGAHSAFPGQENFQTLSILADAQAANNMAAESAKTREKALAHQTATAIDLHQYARGLLTAGKKEEALAVWEINAKKHPNEWPVNAGLARGYSAVGRYKDALKYAKLAAAQAPDEANKKFLEAAIAKLEAGKDMN